MELSAIITRVRSEFLEMPDLCLTPSQAMRLWGLDQAMCNRVIALLVGSAFLRWSSGGRLARTGA
jgi:hypothetical protein